MRELSDLTEKDLKNLVANYERVNAITGPLGSLDDIIAELRKRRPVSLSGPMVKVDVEPWDGKITEFPAHAVLIIARHLSEMANELEILKRDAVAFGQHSDWPWNGFVLSFATYQGSENWTNNVEPRMHDFEWNKVVSLNDFERATLFDTVPNPRFHETVTKNMESVFQSIKAEGGPKPVRDRLTRITTAKKLIAELQRYPGIGRKYARNIPMDVHHPLVRDYFAFDHRLNAIMTVAVGGIPPYDVCEEMMRKVARKLEIEAWDLDRVLYSRPHEIIEELHATPAHGTI